VPPALSFNTPAPSLFKIARHGVICCCKGSKNKPKPDAADQPGAKKAMVTSPGADQPATKKAKTTNPVAGRAASAEAPQAQVEAATEPGGPTSLTAAPVAAGTTVEGADSVAAAGAAALQNQKRRGRPPGSKNKRKVRECTPCETGILCFGASA